MHQLRHYQEKGENCLFQYFETNTGNPGVVLPGGTGKSLLMASFCKRVVTNFPSTRIVCATYVAELVDQNYKELLGIWPDAPAGIVSASLGKKQLNHQIVFAGIQSIWRHAFKLQRVDILLVDEAQAIGRKEQGMWLKFIGELKRINPKLKVIGLSATFYRMDSGMLHQGEGRIFTDIVYEYTLLEAVQDGYLCELVPQDIATRLNVVGVQKRGGEFVPGQLAKAVDIDTVTKEAVRETIEFGVSTNRRSWIIFAAGVQHAEHIRDFIRAHGIDCEMVTDKTPKGERKRILDDFKSYKLRSLVNVTIATVGFNHPGIDLIADFAPTNSEGRHVQKRCRGSRVIYANGFDLSNKESRLQAIAAGPKPNCAVLDYAGNDLRFGPLDQITSTGKQSSGNGEMPQKKCEKCAAYMHISAKLCPDCGEIMPTHSIEDKLTSKASNAALLSTQIKPTELTVKSWELYAHEKAGSAVSLRVAYRTGVTVQSEWCCFQHQGFARDKAVRWWAAHGGQIPPPATVSEAIARKAELTMPRAIVTRPSGKYTEIVGKVW